MVVDRHAGVVVRDVGHNGVQKQPRVVVRQECGCLAFDECIETTLVEDVVVCIRVLVEGGILERSAGLHRVARALVLLYIIDDGKFLGALFLGDVSEDSQGLPNGSEGHTGGSAYSQSNSHHSTA